MNFPEWAKLTEREGRIPLIDVDTSRAYPAMLSELEVEKPDQYWLEVAYQCLKMDVQKIAGFSVEIHFKDPEKKWKQKNFPENPDGKSTWDATKGKEARGHYIKLRGSLPSATVPAFFQNLTPEEREELRRKFEAGEFPERDV